MSGGACPAPQKPPRETATPEKLAWLLTARERLRAISPARAIPSRPGLSTEAFRDEHYAANWPVLMPGEAAGWPAVRRWTPEALKAAVGSAPVQVQAGRDAAIRGL